MFNLLEGDGVIENIYHLLWTKDSIFGTDPNVIMPHTILYKYQKPCYWYFTSKEDNKLKKKSSMKLTVEHIKDVFTKKVSKSGIVAYYIYKKYSLNSKYEADIDRIHSNINSSMFNNPMNSLRAETKDGLYIVEYMDLKKFNDFLLNKMTFDDGILQKFEDPKGEFNSTIRLIWSPKLCIFEKKTNIRKIYDTRFDIYERAVTYDGEEFQTRTDAIKGNNIPDRIEKIGMNIASHIANITLERIKIVRMVLNFKVTNDDKIVFLWCSSLRIDNSLDKKKDIVESYKEPDINKIKLYVPDNINLFKFSNKNKPILPLKDSSCLNCEFKVESYKLYEMSFKTLIESHENRKRDKNYFKLFENVNMTSSGIEIMPYIENKNLEAIEKIKKKNYRNLLIPKVIHSMYPKMKYEDYQILKKDSIFNSKLAYVCESCFLDLTRYCIFLGSNTDNFLKTIRPNLSNIKSKYNQGYNTENNFHSSNDSEAKPRTKSSTDFRLRNFKAKLNADINNVASAEESKNVSVLVSNEKSNSNRNSANMNITNTNYGMSFKGSNKQTMPNIRKMALNENE